MELEFVLELERDREQEKDQMGGKDLKEVESEYGVDSGNEIRMIG